MHTQTPIIGERHAKVTRVERTKTEEEKDNRETNWAYQAKLAQKYKKRCWTHVQQRFLVRALCASVVSSFSTCKFGASELGETLNFTPLPGN
ncbi:hypothetical protein [Paraburkholderia tagetis]|uniref:Uncharacterized protein n=1 Tax=Paraburkholderia tagetis TaxID=2913261 RepID=A0A9X1UIH5_9BURK|nr:hypothetical protein [Paraburkholderia tagetis]MCG5074902.1 hypothetical protein [Paraburkholderia tagetis]